LDFKSNIKMIETSKKSYLVIISAIFIILILAITVNLGIKRNGSLTSSVIQFEPEIITENNVKNHQEISFDIPLHINLTNFYKSYGERLLGNDKVRIISREQWKADDRYADMNFIEKYCEDNFCYSEVYDAEDSFSQQEYWTAKELSLNYKQNFQLTDSFFLQSQEKENKLKYHYLPVEEIIIHHTAGSFTLEFEDSKKEIQRIYLMQAVQRKWQDIGYHYLIDGAGRVFEGNLGGKYAIGIHTYGHNNATLSIALMGDFRPGYNEFNNVMQASLINLIQYLTEEYQFDLSKQEFSLRKIDLSGREKTENFIKGHQEVDLKQEPTECPGVDPEYLRNLIYPYLF